MELKNNEEIMSTRIKNVIGRQLLDSRGNPTVEVDVILDDETGLPLLNRLLPTQGTWSCCWFLVLYGGVLQNWNNDR